MKDGGTAERRDGGTVLFALGACMQAFDRSAVATFAILATAALPACEDSGARPTTTIQAPDSADQVLEGFSHYVTSDGIRRSRVEADTAYFYEATQITNLANLKVTFYDLKGAESSTLTARRGLYRWQDGSMEANDNVVVVAPDGRRLATERLRYDNATNQISTDLHFTFDRGAEHLEGNSFRSDPDFRNVVTDRPRGVAGDGMLLPGQQAEQ
ncbi:MAG: LPS export ABC transporter periplasmic protein LptC [Gemmatimonadales bacterium]|nr:LPS export ABC transporter periplasmic protein LptC [Gemmatimonadales bacterium]